MEVRLGVQLVAHACGEADKIIKLKKNAKTNINHTVNNKFVNGGDGIVLI